MAATFENMVQDFGFYGTEKILIIGNEHQAMFVATALHKAETLLTIHNTYQTPLKANAGNCGGGMVIVVGDTNVLQHASKDDMIIRVGE